MRTKQPSQPNYSGQNIVPSVCKDCGRTFTSKVKLRKHRQTVGESQDCARCR